MQNGDLDTKRERMVEVLQGRADLTGVTILAETIGDLRSRIDTAMGKHGVCCVVKFAKAGVEQHQSRKASLNPVTFVVSILENVTVNRSPVGTQKSAGYIAERVVSELHMLRIGTDVLRATSIVPADEDLPLNFQGLRVLCETRADLLPRHAP